MGEEACRISSPRAQVLSKAGHQEVFVFFASGFPMAVVVGIDHLNASWLCSGRVDGVVSIMCSMNGCFGQ